MLIPGKLYKISKIGRNGSRPGLRILLTKPQVPWANNIPLSDYPKAVYCDHKKLLLFIDQIDEKYVRFLNSDGKFCYDEYDPNEIDKIYVQQQ